MEPRRTTARRGGTLVLVALLVLGASACSGGAVGRSPAATVGDTDISQDRLQKLVDGYRALYKAEGKEAQAQLKQRTAEGQASGNPPTQTAEGLQAQIDQALEPFTKTSDSTYPTTGAAAQLTELIRLELYQQAVADQGAKVTGAQRSKAEENLTQQFLTFAQAPKIVRETLIDRDAALLALQAKAPRSLRDALVTAADDYEKQLKDIYTAQQASFRQICGRVLAAADETAAKSAITRLEGGEAFETVRAELSKLSEEQSAQQCFEPSQIAQAFSLTAEPKAGDALGPLADAGTADTGPVSIVLYVEALQSQPFETVRETIAQQVPDNFTPKAQAALERYLNRVLDKVTRVTVNSRFGAWDDESGSVVPPVVPTVPTTAPKKSKTTTTTVPVATGP